MIRPVRFLLASSLLAAASLVHAQSPAAPDARPRPFSPILATLDADRDGVISATEISAASVALTALDLDEDGTISSSERTPVVAAPSEGRPPRTPRRSSGTFNVLLALDANHDGALQSFEVAQAGSSLKRLDVNGDGRLTPDELRGMAVAHH